MPAPLTMKCSLSTPVLPATGQQRMVYLLVEVGGGGLQDGAESLPIHLGMVIDCSDSMRIRLVTNEQFAQLARYGNAQEVMTDGIPAYQISAIPSELLQSFPRRIDYVAEALVIASEYLRPVDCFMLVAFAGQAITVIPSSSGRERARLQQAARDLEHLHLGDNTNMDEGLALMLDEIQRRSADQCAGRLIVLTDGHTRNVQACYAWARRAREAGLSLTTMGIGSEFNEDLLIPLADLTGGSAYYIETPDQIPAAFRKELGAALRISYRDVDVKLAFPAGISLRRVHRVLPELGGFDPGPDMGGSYALLLGNYDPTMPQTLLLELVVPAWVAGNYRLAQAVLSWEDPDGGPARPHQRQDVVIRIADGVAPSYYGHVMNIVEKVGAFKLGTQALESIQQGLDNPQQRGAVTQRLRQAATRLLDLGEANLADAMRLQADAIDAGGAVDPNTTKKLRYETRRITGTKNEGQ